VGVPAKIFEVTLGEDLQLSLTQFLGRSIALCLVSFDGLAAA
jgi:hypothetical protein